MRQRINLAQRVFLGSVALTLINGVCSGASIDERSARLQAESLRLRCGARAAWAFSQACEVPLDYDDVMHSFVQQDEAVSVKEIATFLSVRGIGCETRRLSPTDFRHVDVPVIAHLAPKSKTDDIGHFVVVIAITESGVTVVEPQLGRREEWSWPTFSDRSTGYCIIRSQDSSWDRRLLFLCTSLSLMVTLWLIFH